MKPRAGVATRDEQARGHLVQSPFTSDNDATRSFCSESCQWEIVFSIGGRYGCPNGGRRAVAGRIEEEAAGQRSGK